MMQIGPLKLQDFEIPTWIAFGGRHRFALHRSASGQRIVEDLGPDEGDLQFQGVFTGPQGNARAEILDTLRLMATPVWLSWSTFRYRIVIKDLRLQYHGPLWIRYAATCLILDQPGVSVSVVSTALQIAADVGSAITLAGPLGLDFSNLPVLLSAANIASAGSAPRFAASTAVTAATQAVGSLMTAATGSLASYQQASLAPAMAASIIQSAVTNASIISQGVLMTAYLARIARAL